MAVNCVSVARCNNDSVADFAAFNSCKAYVDSLGFAWSDTAKFEVQSTEAAAVFEAIWYVVCYDDVFSVAATTVSYSDNVVDWISWANFIRTAFFANEYWFSAEEGAESNWSSSSAEASALLAFTLALHPDFSWSAFAFFHWTI